MLQGGETGAEGERVQNRWGDVEKEEGGDTEKDKNQGIWEHPILQIIQKDTASEETWPGLRSHGLTRESLSSLQHLLYVSHHDPLHVLELCVDAAQIPSRSAVNVRLLGFLDVGVWRGSGRKNKKQLMERK